jgi:hypothetical protein
VKAPKSDSIVTMPDIPVMYVAGERGKPFQEQAPDSFSRLEGKLSSLKGRKFYDDIDTSRPCIEFYRSQRELFILVPAR